jgi:hypothetical protein
MRGKVVKLIKRNMFNGVKQRDMDAGTRNEYRKVKRLYKEVKKSIDKNKTKMV